MNKKMIKIMAITLLLISCNIRAETSANTPYFYLISSQEKFIFFAVPKTGYSSISTMIRDNNNQTNTYFDYIELDNFENYFKFSFIRNPWDRIVSAYLNLIVTKRYDPFEHLHDQDFDFFVNYIANQDLNNADIHIRTQRSLIPPKIDYIGRFEYFHDDLSHILDKIGLHGKEISHLNKSEHLHYSHYYNDITREIIAEKYKDDIEAFGYKFEMDPLEIE